MTRDRSACGAVLVLLVLSCALLKGATAQPERQCATTCHAMDCDQANLAYGKYCGISHTGCPGEEPCDEADACCQRHDECVGVTGLFNANSCHEDFIQCLQRVEQKGKKGFSKQCPYEVIIPTMKQGIQMAMAFTSMFGGAFPKDNSEL